MRFTHGLVTSLLLVATVSGAACSNLADDCDNTSTCMSGGSSSGASAGSEPEAGQSSGGATGGSGGSSSGSGGSSAGTPHEGGTGGAHGGIAGAADGGGGMSGGEGGTSAVKPCDGACDGATPICDEATQSCVECLGAPDCSSSSDKACDPLTHRCVECVGEQDCAAPTPHCDTAVNSCVECLATPDCASATAARCNAGTCVKCTSNQDCAHIAGKGVCDSKAGECVQCTGKDYAACGSSAGTPLVCDSLQRTCSTQKEKAAGLCLPCVSDAHCDPGQLCVKQTYGTPAQDVGYFCFWKKGDTANGAPANCFPDSDPFATTVTNQTSVDGTSGDVCGLRKSTCVARNEFSSKDCATANAPDDQKCGFAPTEDSKCALVEGTAYRCTMTCLSSDDCPGAPCDTSVTPAVCDLTP